MKLLKLQKDGAIATLTLSRPDILNAIGQEGDADNFYEICSDLNKDKSIKVIILTGEGKAFSAGGDVKAMRDKTGYFAGNSADIMSTYKFEVHKIVKAFWGLEIPVIAAINGPAVGMGFDLASMSDIRIASKNAKFGMTFLKIGLIAGDGGAWLAPRTIGLARASQMLYTGEIIDAQKALEWNFISEIVEPDELIDAAMAIAVKIIQQPSHAIRITKSLLRRSLNASFDDVMDLSAAYQGILHNTDEHFEGIAAIIEKRKPNFG